MDCMMNKINSENCNLDFCRNCSVLYDAIYCLFFHTISILTIQREQKKNKNTENKSHKHCFDLNYTTQFAPFFSLSHVSFVKLCRISLSTLRHLKLVSSCWQEWYTEQMKSENSFVFYGRVYFESWEKHLKKEGVIIVLLLFLFFSNPNTFK